MATPGFLEDYAKDFATQAKAAYSVPIDTAKFTGRQFVAGEDPLQTQAIGIAQQGVGAYKPFLSAAQAAQQQAAGTVGGLGALTGPQDINLLCHRINNRLLIQHLQNLIDKGLLLNKQ